MLAMNPCKIIIADDHVVFTNGLQIFLSCAVPGAVITEVRSSEDLIKEIIKNDFSLVICDIDMGGRSGLYALEQIKRIKPLIPVLMLSWHDESVYGVLSIRTGASAYISKTVDPDELLKAVNILLSGKKYMTDTLREYLLFDLETDVLFKLTNQEIEILKLSVSGYDNHAIADHLSLSISTITTEKNKALHLLNLHSHAELVKFALRKKLIRDI